MWEVASELGSIDHLDLGFKLYPLEIFKTICGWSVTFYTADYAAQFVGMILGIVFGDSSSGLPVLADETYFDLAFPASFSISGMAIMKTLAWYFGLACIILIELG